MNLYKLLILLISLMSFNSYSVILSSNNIEPDYFSARLNCNLGYLLNRQPFTTPLYTVNGSVFCILNEELGKEFVTVQNVNTGQILSLEKYTLGHSIDEVDDVSKGDTVALLSSNSSYGQVVEVFTDKTIIILDKTTGTFTVGKRPKKMIRNLPSDYIDKKVKIIDSNHFQGHTLEFFEDDFVYYAYAIKEKDPSTQRGFRWKWYNKITKLISPPYTELEIDTWINQLTKECSRNSYFHKGSSGAQLLISKKLFKEDFGKIVFQKVNSYTQEEFYNISKYFVWTSTTPKEASKKIHGCVLKHIKYFL